MALKFSEEVIQQLFGHEAAEDETPERLREYYFKSSVYDQVVTDLPLRILVGHKGIGKSALFQVAIAEDRDAQRLTLVVKPDDVIEIANDTTDFLQTIRAWKLGLTELLGNKAILGLDAVPDDGWRERLRRTGGKLIEFLRASIESPENYFDISPTKQLVAQAFLKRSEISVYIDDLDRGWQGRPQDITRISALLNAVRDIANDNRGIRFRISLRSDVYFLVRTSDESTDKIQGSVIWQSWTNSEIFVVLVKRINSYFDGKDRPVNNLEHYSQEKLAAYLDPIFEPTFRGQGHWRDAPTRRVLLSLIRGRPRDLIKLCTLAARDARASGSPIIRTANLTRVFEDYSQDRIQDTVNEFRSELPEVERLIFGMKPSKKERTTKEGYTYTTALLLQKIRNIQEQGQFRLRSGRIADAKDLAAFMYKINFLTARKEVSSGLIERRYFEEARYLQSRFVDFGFDWEVHPAYRWALQPDDLNSIFNEVRLSTDDSGSPR
jgi:hypothetical protein